MVIFNYACEAGNSYDVCLYLLMIYCAMVQLGQIGRIPNEWARCLLPLVRDKKIRIEGSCKSAPAVMSLMDTVILSVRYAHMKLNKFKNWRLSGMHEHKLFG